MQRENIESKIIKSIGYDAIEQTLEIEFIKDGSVWQYFGFSEINWHEFKISDSKEKYWRGEIQGNYKNSRVG